MKSNALLCFPSIFVKTKAETTPANNSQNTEIKKTVKLPDFGLIKVYLKMISAGKTLLQKSPAILTSKQKVR